MLRGAKRRGNLVLPQTYLSCEGASCKEVCWTNMLDVKDGGARQTEERGMRGEAAGTRAYGTRCAGETCELGHRLAALLCPGDVVLLVGELGAGKTCFAQGVARGLEVTEQVTSPTFTLMREYHGRMPLYHLDAYRLEGPADLFAIGVDEYLDGDGVLLVEWGDRARDFFTLEYLEVRFDFADGDEERRIRFIARGGSWQQRLLEMPAGSERHGLG